MLTHGIQQCLQIDLNTAAMNTGVILHEHYLITSQICKQKEVFILPLHHIYITCGVGYSQ